VEAIQEETANANLPRKKPPEPTLQTEKTSASKEHDDKTMFEEGNADNVEFCNTGDSNDDGAEAVRLTQTEKSRWQ
jgi:hypothetical protein